MRERQGKGIPLDLLLLVLDVDADRDHNEHLIDDHGICDRCLSSAKQKLESVRRTAEPERCVFSGSKGYHLHYQREISSAEMLEFLAEINKHQELVDDFTFARDGVKQFDMHRIFKVPGTVDATTACVIDEDLKRLDVKDQIVKLKV